MALRCSSVVLRQAPEEVWNQVHGRAGIALQASQARAIPRFDLRFATLLPADEALMHILEGHTNLVSGCALSADGQLALSASYDQTLRLWEISSGKLLRTLEGHTSGVYGCALSADGQFALSASSDKTLRLWEVSSGRLLRTLEGHTSGVRGCALSADGTLALSASSDNTLRLWEVSSGRLLRILEGHTGWVYGCALSADGTLALSASADKTLRLWEVSSGRELCRWRSDAAILCCAFGPDAKTVIAGDSVRSLHFLSLVMQ